MEPTLQIGDHLLVVKWAYGWRDPVFGHPISETKQPKRGELLVFRFPEDRSHVFIKRCIGLPGETVEVRGSAVLVGGRRLSEPYVQFLEVPFSSELSLGQADPRGSWGPQTVPVDMYFVLGDNRDNSRDSRFWGFVPQEDLLGRANVVYWSYAATREEYRRTNSAEWLKDTLSAFGRTRWNRIGRLLE
jgi:signal peptidase I